MYSKYIDNSKGTDDNYLSLDEILENIVNYQEWKNNESDPYTGEDLNYEIVKVFDDNQILDISGSSITYNYIKYSYDTVITQQEDNPIAAERLKTTYGALVIYSDGARTQYLVDKARGSNALRILRVINNADQNKIIEAQPFKFEEDFFIWLISRFMNESSVLDEEKSLRLNRIIGFRGERGERQAILSGSGNEVMNLLSSLSFLIEMDTMTEISTRLEYGNDTIEIQFYSKKSQLDINLVSYVGDYMLLPDDSKNPKVLLTSFIEVIPSIINAYNEDIKTKSWDKAKRKEFILGIADSVKDRLDVLYDQGE